MFALSMSAFHFAISVTSSSRMRSGVLVPFDTLMAPFSGAPQIHNGLCRLRAECFARIA
jgi:hypothetical protein